MSEMRQHCAQCLIELYANGRQTPAGEMLCSSCYSALWDPKISEEFRSMVRLHTGRRLVSQTAR
jgi:hypothetical protein